MWLPSGGLVYPPHLPARPRTPSFPTVLTIPLSLSCRGILERAGQISGAISIWDRGKAVVT